MTTKKKQALEAALSALESERIMAADVQGNYTVEVTPKRIIDAIAKVKAALAEPEQEPAHISYNLQWRGWQAAIASRAPAKDIDTEALKRSQENASKAWAGVDVEKFLQREPQPMPLEKAEELAHRTASRYTHKSDRSFTAYTFLPHTLEDFVRKIEKHHGIG